MLNNNNILLFIYCCDTYKYKMIAYLLILINNYLIIFIEEYSLRFSSKRMLNVEREEQKKTIIINYESVTISYMLII